MRSRLVPVLLATLAVAVAAVGVAALTGRGQALGLGDGLGFLDTPYYRVLYDDDATGADVVDVSGSPDAVVALDDGTEVRHHTIADQEGGEAQKAAVEVRRPGARPLARLVDPRLDLAAAGDHAVLHSQEGEVTTLDPDGTLTVVTRTVTQDDGTLGLSGLEPADGVEAGDVLVGTVDEVTLYRPGTRTVHVVPLPEHEEGVVPLVAIDAGRVWLVEADDRRATVRSSTDGVAWTEVAYPLAGAYPVDVRADGEVLAVLDASPSFVASTVHLVRGDDVRSLAVRGDLRDALLARTPAGRLLVGSDGGWLVESGGVLDDLDVPGPARSMTAVGSRVVALGDGEAWTSPDDGATWRALDD